MRCNSNGTSETVTVDFGKVLIANDGSSSADKTLHNIVVDTVWTKPMFPKYLTKGQTVLITQPIGYEMCYCGAIGKKSDGDFSTHDKYTNGMFVNPRLGEGGRVYTLTSAQEIKDVNLFTSYLNIRINGDVVDGDKNYTIPSGATVDLSCSNSRLTRARYILATRLADAETYPAGIYRCLGDGKFEHMPLRVNNVRVKGRDGKRNSGVYSIAQQDGENWRWKFAHDIIKIADRFTNQYYIYNGRLKHFVEFVSSQNLRLLVRIHKGKCSKWGAHIRPRPRVDYSLVDMSVFDKTLSGYVNDGTVDNRMLISKTGADPTDFRLDYIDAYLVNAYKPRAKWVEPMRIRVHIRRFDDELYAVAVRT